MTEPTRPKPLRGRLPQKKMLLPLAVPILAVEWVLEWIDFATSQMALFRVLGNLARLSILVAVVSYFMSADERREAAADAKKAKHYQAWQMLHAAARPTTTTGRWWGSRSTTRTTWTPPTPTPCSGRSTEPVTRRRGTSIRISGWDSSTA